MYIFIKNGKRKIIIIDKIIKTEVIEVYSLPYSVSLILTRSIEIGFNEYINETAPVEGGTYKTGTKNIITPNISGKPS